MGVGKGGCASAGGGGGGGWVVGVGVARRGVRGGCNSQTPGVHISCTGGARNVGGGAAGWRGGGWSRRRAGTLIIRKVGHTDAGPTLAPEKRCQICAFFPPPPPPGPPPPPPPSPLPLPPPPVTPGFHSSSSSPRATPPALAHNLWCANVLVKTTMNVTLISNNK